MILQFDVINQRIVRKDDNYIVANSQFYLQMDFNFTQDWYGFGKTITFVGNAKKYSIGLNADNSCVVPFDVIKTPSFSFSIKGILDDVIITTNVCVVPIKPSGETQGVAPVDPPKEILSGLQNGLKGQVLGKVSDDNYDYEFQNLKNLQYDDENTLGDILEGLVIDAVTDVKYEDGKLKKQENGEWSDIVSIYTTSEVYTKQEIDDLLQNLDKYIEKSDTLGLIKNDGTVDTTEYATQNALNAELLAREQADTRIEGQLPLFVKKETGNIHDDEHIKSIINPNEEGMIVIAQGNEETNNGSSISMQCDYYDGTSAGASLINMVVIDASGETPVMSMMQITDNSIVMGSKDVGVVAEHFKYNNKEVAVIDNITKEQVGLGNVVNTGDSATPVENGTQKFTTGGAYTLKTNLEQADSNEALARSTNDNALATAVSDRQCLFVMENVVLNNWTDVGIPQEFENYSYVAVIRNSVIVGAQSVNVLFTITQILSDNYCPSPLIDNVEGTIKIFGNDNMTITLPRVEIFKSVEYSIPEEEE